jgi:hypothetical protein
MTMPRTTTRFLSCASTALRIARMGVRVRLGGGGSSWSPGEEHGGLVGQLWRRRRRVGLHGGFKLYALLS